MPEYKLTRKADADLVEIYTYTYLEFGEARADAYFESLHECLARLADNPLQGLDISSLRQGLRRFVHRRHSIYYAPVTSGIHVVRILGPGMSIEYNLP